MITLGQALGLYDEHIARLPQESELVLRARGRVLAEPALAEVDLPMFSQSAVDGYALRGGDCGGASAQSPVQLALVGEVVAGDGREHRLEAGQALRVFTGGRLPAGADTIARQEIVVRDGEHIRLDEPVAVGADVRYAGEELRAGDAIAEAGARIGPGLLAALAMAGAELVQVQRRPRVAILVTGDEVAPAGSALKPGQIFDANGPLMSAWLQQRGLAPAPVVYLRDDPDAIAQGLERALAESDLVLSSGGVSVGDRDFLPPVAERLKVQQVFWKVAQKPGKPLWFGTRGGCALLAMPGNPAAVLVGLEVHAARILSLLEGDREIAPLWRTGLLASALRGDAWRDCLVRMRRSVDGQGRVLLERLPRQDSHMLSNLVSANALAWVPRAEQELAAGTAVPWIPLSG